MSGYFDCVCCGTTDIRSEEEDPALCDSCILCECGEEGDSPECRHCIIDGARGIYIPQQFAQYFSPEEWGISEEDTAILKEGPDHDLYWETWNDIVGYVERDWQGKRWVLTQDDSLFIECVGAASAKS